MRLYESSSGCPSDGPVDSPASPDPPNACLPRSRRRRAGPAGVPSGLLPASSPVGLATGRHGGRKAGWLVNNKRIHRLWRAEGLRVPYRKRKKPLRGIGVAVGAFCPIRPNVVWALDFQFDQTADGRMFKLLNIIDEFTRECLAIDVERSIDADGVVRCLDRLAERPRRSGLRALRPRARVHRLRGGRLVPVQRHRHHLHRPRHPHGRTPGSNRSTAAYATSTSTASSSRPCSRPESFSRTGESTTTSTGHTAHTAGSPRSSSSRPGSTNNS